MAAIHAAAAVPIIPERRLPVFDRRLEEILKLLPVINKRLKERVLDNEPEMAERTVVSLQKTLKEASEMLPALEARLIKCEQEQKDKRLEWQKQRALIRLDEEEQKERIRDTKEKYEEITDLCIRIQSLRFYLGIKPELDLSTEMGDLKLDEDERHDMDSEDSPVPSSERTILRLLELGYPEEEVKQLAIIGERQRMQWLSIALHAQRKAAPLEVKSNALETRFEFLKKKAKAQALSAKENREFYILHEKIQEVNERLTSLKFRSSSMSDLVLNSNQIISLKMGREGFPYINLGWYDFSVCVREDVDPKLKRITEFALSLVRNQEQRFLQNFFKHNPEIE